MVFLAVTFVLACPGPEPSRLELVGVLLDDEPAERVAVLRDPRSGRSFTVHEGDDVEASQELQVEAGALVVRRYRARVERIERGRVILERRQGREEAASASAWVEQRGCRPLLDFARAGEVAMQARIVPAFERGIPIGFKLFSIRPGSVWSHVGLQNGDVIERINGLDLTSPEKAMTVYSTLRCARRFEVEVRRRGEPLSLVLLPAEQLNDALLVRGRGRFVVSGLEPRAPLARAGLRDGDVVERIEGHPLQLVMLRAGQRRRLIVTAIEAANPSASASVGSRFD